MNLSALLLVRAAAVRIFTEVSQDPLQQDLGVKEDFSLFISTSS